MNVALIIALLAAVAGPLVAYITANRRLSGKVATSEAASLWAEAASQREDYRGRLAESERRQAHLEERVAKLEEKNNALMGENLELRKKNMELELEMERIKERCAGLERENEHLKTTLRRFGGLDAGT